MSEQELGLSTLRGPDRNWMMGASNGLVVSHERMNAASQKVKITNTDPEMTHIVIDKFYVGHELRPGQSKSDIEMLTSEIENIVALRMPGRTNNAGVLLPQYPLVIDDDRYLRQMEAKEKARNEQKNKGG